MEAHFFIKLESHMEHQVVALFKSIEFLSGLDNFYFTIMMPKGQKLRNKKLNKISDFIYYENPDNLHPIWSGAIRYFLEPKTDVCFMVDADILVLNSLVDLVRKISEEKAFYGALAYASPFDEKKLYNWELLYKEFNLNIEIEKFKKHVEDGSYCPPCYFNNGFLGLHRELMPKIAPFVKKYVYAINNKKTKYKGQISLCLAIEDSKIEYKILDYRYNFSGHLKRYMIDDYNNIFNDLKVYHYCKEKDIIKIKKSILVNNLRISNCLKLINNLKIY